MQQTLYDRDFYAWIYHNIELVRAGKWEEIDKDLLIEELESMARRDKHELVNHLIILLAHLLKWQFQLQQLANYWDSWQGGSWQASIVEQRKQIARQLEMSPSLKPYLTEAIKKAYPDAVDVAVKETKLESSIFPEVCSYTIEQILDDNFYPEEQESLG